MKFLFTYFGYSFTPFFLRKYSKSLTLGKSIGYYFFWSFIFGIFITIASIVVTWHFSAFEKASLWLSRVPAFEFVFEENQLIKTSFPNDPHSVTIENEQIGIISPTTTLDDILNSDEVESGIYMLRDGFAVVESTGGMQEIDTYEYAKIPIRDVVINNASLPPEIRKIYSDFRAIVLIFVPILVAIGWILITIFHLVVGFIWAGILRFICLISGFPKFTYKQLAGFSFYTYFFDILLTSIVFSVAGLWTSLFLSTIVGSSISLAIFFWNVWLLKK